MNSPVEHQQEASSERPMVHQDPADLPRAGLGEDPGHHGRDSQEKIQRAKDSPQHPDGGDYKLYQRRLSGIQGRENSWNASSNEDHKKKRTKKEEGSPIRGPVDTPPER